MAAKSSHAYLLTVLTGPNAGAQVGLDGRRVSLGGTDGADILLDHFSGEMVDLSFSKNRARIKTERPGVVVNDDTDSLVSGSSIVALPAKIQLDEAIQVFLCKVPKSQKPGFPQLAATGFAVLLFGMIVAGVEMGGKSTARASVLMSMNQTAPSQDSTVQWPVANSQVQAAVAVDEPTQQPDFASPATAAEAFSQLAKDAGLSDLIVTADQDAVRVTGFHAPGQEKIWREIRGNYDLQWGYMVPMIVDISVEIIEPPLAITSVWLGDDPEVVTRNGDVLGLGDETSTGWIVEEIRANEVHLVRGSQKAAVVF